jgi:two-component sensor histidine kinase
VKYETEQKDQRIASQSGQIEQQNKIQLLSYAIVGLLILLLGGLFFTYRSNQKKNLQLQVLNSSLETTNIQLDKRNTENELLLKEIHHRVKNNLQTVSALLRLQARRIDNPEASQALNEAVRRIASIALVHETLSGGSDASVGFDDVLDRLVSHALELTPRLNEITISRTGQLGSVDPRIATPLALVITELIYNALEHGLEEEGTELTIAIKRDGQSAHVTIIDDGVGLPAGFDLTQSSNLGLQIVRTLTENELRGTLNLISNAEETRAELSFPLT